MKPISQRSTIIARYGLSAILMSTILSEVAGAPELTVGTTSQFPQPPSKGLLQPPQELLAQTANDAPKPKVGGMPAYLTGAPTISFPENPTDSDLIVSRCLEVRLAPLPGDETPGEDEALARALVDYSHSPEDLGPLEGFLRKRPNSRWRASLLLNMGLACRNQARWSKVIPLLTEAWNLSKGENAVEIRAVADRALGELTDIHSRLGHVDQVRALLDESKDRDVRGPGVVLVKYAKDGLGLMEEYPGEGYRCGPLALASLYQIKFPGTPLPSSIDGYKSTSSGTNLEQVHQWAKELNLDYQVAYRSPGADVIVPSVIHWKVGHFAALTSGVLGRYISRDSTFGLSNVVSAEVLDSEASGYFLVPTGSLPKGWRTVTADEAKGVYGKGGANHPGPPCPFCLELHPNCTTCQSVKTPMASYSFGATSVSLALTDTPVGYSPPVGSRIEFTVFYNSQEASDQTALSNVGTGWTMQWLSYLQLKQNPANGLMICYGPGGGVRSFGGFNSQTGYYAPELLSQDVLQQLSPTNFVLTHPDGSKDIYRLSDGGTVPNIFRTSSVDRLGNTITYGYDGSLRLISITDAIGQVTRLYYGLTTNATSADFFRVTSVTDPFNRTATFTYSNGQLTSITDVLNITSAFTYGSNNFVASLTTPYGTTSFSTYGNGLNQSGLQAQDPLGGQERMEWDLAVIPPLADFNNQGVAPSNVVPAGIYNGNLVYRNTFYWDKKAMMVGAGDYNKAVIYHWLHDALTGNSTTGYVLESSKAPLENRVYRTYAGQTITYYEGTSNLPAKIARILDDGTEQDNLAQYNSLGNITQSTDPVGRTITYNYEANGIDVASVTVRNGSSQDLNRTYTYNGAHLPLTETDAAGQTTTYTYNSFGEPLTVTDAKNETTTYSYNSTGYLQSVTGPIAGATTTFTYDSAGRVRTVTDSEGYTLTMDYDAADRPTKVTYPDGTFTQVIYNRLDVEWTRDRLGRWTLTQHDALRHLIVEEDPLLRKTLFEYCTCGALIAITDPNGNRTAFNRDLQERLTQKVFEDGTSVNLTYENTTSRLKSATDAKGQTKTYTYYPDNSIRSVSYSNTAVPTPAVSYTYDQNYLRITAMTDGVGTTTYSYNPITTTPAVGANMLGSVSGPLANSNVSYTYDKLGRTLTSSINGTANISSLAYDPLGRVTSIANLLGQFGYQYVDQTSRVMSVSFPNGQMSNFGYYPNASTDTSGDGDQRLESIQNLSPTGTNLSTFVYTYDSDGEVVTWNKQWNGGSSRPSAFSYDAANQLLSGIVPNPNTFGNQAFFYTYDPSGNRIQEQVDSSINTSTFNSTNEYSSETAGGTMAFEGSVSEPATITVGGNAASVDSFNNWLGSAAVVPGTESVPLVATDSQGNTTRKTIDVAVTGGPNRALTYDSNGNLISNGVGQTFQWDAENRLVGIVQASGTTGFVYDGAGHRVQETLNGTLIKQWVWCGNTPCEERDASGNVTKRFYAQGEQIAGAPYYFTRDHLGSVREMTDGSGAIRAQYDYDPYGRLTKMSGDLSADFGFTGDYYHAATGLSLTMYRAYDPNLGRWLSRDPAGETEGLNLYEYVLDNPIGYSDPYGLAVYVGERDVDGLGGIAEHTAIVLRPDVPSDFSSNILFNGSNQATLSAEPQDSDIIWYGNLISHPNNPKDSPGSTSGCDQGKLKNLTPVPTPAGMTDTQFIQSLISANHSYHNNLPYDPVPESLDPGFYNSNSYTSGIILNAGGTPPTLPGWIPGYHVPIPLGPH